MLPNMSTANSGIGPLVDVRDVTKVYPLNQCMFWFSVKMKVVEFA